MGTYAADHNGAFPRSTNGPYAALQELYPDYVGLGYELAGLSGPWETITNALVQKTPLDATLTSWVYVQGLRSTNHPRTALFWESKAGLYWSGRRSPSGSRAVMLLDATVTNALPADWAPFQQYQSNLLFMAGITNGVYREVGPAGRASRRGEDLRVYVLGGAAPSTKAPRWNLPTGSRRRGSGLGSGRNNVSAAFERVRSGWEAPCAFGPQGRGIGDAGLSGCRRSVTRIPQSGASLRSHRTPRPRGRPNAAGGRMVGAFGWAGEWVSQWHREVALSLLANPRFEPGASRLSDKQGEASITMRTPPSGSGRLRTAALCCLCLLGLLQGCASQPAQSSPKSPGMSAILAKHRTGPFELSVLGLPKSDIHKAPTESYQGVAIYRLPGARHSRDRWNNRVVLEKTTGRY